MAVDMALELRSRGVASVSLWPGPVKTEQITQLVLSDDAPQEVDSKVGFSPAANRTCRMLSFSLSFSALFHPQTKELFAHGESTEFSGLCIVNLAQGRPILDRLTCFNFSTQRGVNFQSPVGGGATSDGNKNPCDYDALSLFQKRNRRTTD